MLLRSSKIFFLALTVFCCLVACTARQESGKEDRLPRAAPGYLQWLERQSLLGASSELTSQVSGTELLWRNSSSGHSPQILLEAAPNWLLLNPYTLSSGQPLFRTLNTSPLTGLMPEMGFQGLFIAPSGERGDIWTKQEDPSPLGENIVSFRFDRRLGVEADFDSLLRLTEKLGIQLGGELPSAATGMGPDFILQARRASRFDGIYAMLPVPRKNWPMLPSLPDEFGSIPLRPESVAALVESGLLPPSVSRDALSWVCQSGWACTGEIRGADGQPRRWVYRYSGDHLRPVLFWQDPSGQARRIFSAAIIRHVGLQRQSLAGLRMEALLGLDATPQEQADGVVNLSPGVEALEDTAREIHRYGGWAMQDEVFPPSLTNSILAGPVDFTRESVIPAAVAVALLTQDTSLLTDFLQSCLTQNIDFSRLAHGLHSWQGIDWRPVFELPLGREVAARVQRTAGLAGDLYLAASPTAISALALGYDIDEALDPEHVPALRQSCLLMLSLRLGLPGLAFVSPQDLTGSFWLERNVSILSRSLTPLWDQRQIDRISHTNSQPLIFGSLDTQWANKKSFLHDVAYLLRLRYKFGLAQGRLYKIIDGPNGCLAIINRLPSGKYWILTVNFTAKTQTLDCILPDRATRVQNIFPRQGSLELADNGRNLKLRLAPRQARHILLDISSHPKLQGATP